VSTKNHVRSFALNLPAECSRPAGLSGTGASSGAVDFSKQPGSCGVSCLGSLQCCFASWWRGGFQVWAAIRCTEQIRDSDAILVENLDVNYLVFERAAALYSTGLAPQVLSQSARGLSRTSRTGCRRG
jgi:hypothetical protein